MITIILCLLAIACIIFCIYYALRYRTLCQAKEDARLEQARQFELATKEFEQSALELQDKISSLELDYEKAKEDYIRTKEQYKYNLMNTIMNMNSKKEERQQQIEEELKSYQSKVNAEKESLNQELQELTNTLQARLEAGRREQEIQEDKDKYCLTLSLAEENDIRTLTELKSKLHNPRILSMLIWQTYFQKPLTALCTKNVGAGAKTGIYKITNQITGECYIGQAVSIQDRWKEHAKYGLGIDTPDGNKLYKNMQQYGLQNFSWEVLEECNKTQLDEKEAYYINIYQSKDFGLNTLAGRNVKKK